MEWNEPIALAQTERLIFMPAKNRANGASLKSIQHPEALGNITGNDTIQFPRPPKTTLVRILYADGIFRMYILHLSLTGWYYWMTQDTIHYVP